MTILGVTLGARTLVFIAMMLVFNAALLAPAVRRMVSDWRRLREDTQHPRLMVKTFGPVASEQSGSAEIEIAHIPFLVEWGAYVKIFDWRGEHLLWRLEGDEASDFWQEIQEGANA